MVVVGEKKNKTKNANEAKKGKKQKEKVRGSRKQSAFKKKKSTRFRMHGARAERKTRREEEAIDRQIKRVRDVPVSDG